MTKKSDSMIKKIVVGIIIGLAVIYLSSKLFTDDPQPDPNTQQEAVKPGEGRG